MSEHLALDAPKSSNGEINPFHSPEHDFRIEAGLDLGIRAVKLLHALDVAHPSESTNTHDNSVSTGGAETMTDSQEGERNAELFKQSYDVAVGSIDAALQVDGSELGDKLAAILSNIDALQATPYISSVPEFVSMVQSAKSCVELADVYPVSDDDPTYFAVTEALLRARRLLSGTLVAYRP